MKTMKDEFNELSERFDPANIRVGKHEETYTEFWCSLNRLLGKWDLLKVCDGG